MQRGSTLGIWLGGVICLLVMLLPVGSPARVAVLNGTGVAAAVVFLWAVLTMPRHARVVWWWLWGYLCLTVIGDLTYDVYLYHFQREPFPSPADVFYLSAYAALIVALVTLVHRRQSGRNRETWIDTAVMSLAAVCVVATVVVVPILNDSVSLDLATWVALAYPLLDVVALSVLIRLLVDVDRVNSSLGLLTISVAMMLTADLAFQSLVAQDVIADAPAWVDVLFLAALLLLTAAACANGATHIARAAPTTRRTRARLVGLAIAALTAPTLLAYSVWSDVGSGARLLAVVSIAIILLILWGALILISMVEQQAALLADLARRDGLTGLPNRRTWDFELDRTAERLSQNPTPLTVAMLDLDHFKRFNDQHGHPAGDALLIDCSHTWHALLDPPAIIARYGGEEFAVLLPDTTWQQAQPVLDRMRRATPKPQTVSIGYAQCTPGEDIRQTVARADQALYRAKASGRDCLVADEMVRHSESSRSR